MSREDDQNWPLTCDLAMARPMVTKFGVYLYRDRTSSNTYYTGYGWSKCLLFRISETAGRIALEFGVWLETF